MVTGYKCFDENLQCHNNFQYEVGKRYKHNGEIKLCESGFHFCRKVQDVFSYYPFDIKNRVCEIVAHGELFDGDDKSVTDDIEIVRELAWSEVLELVNSGKANSGLANSGNWNSGDRNSGNWNSGNWNSGDRNSGDRNSSNWNSGNWNSGDRNSGYRNSGNWNSGYRNSGDRNSSNWNSGNWNSGDRNSGNWNSGDRNSGNWNSGNWNSGDRNSGNWNSGNWNSGYRNSGNWNSGNWNSGLFCSDTPKMRIFNKQTDIEFENFFNDDKYGNIRYVLYYYEFPLTYWLSFDDMTEEEKEEYKRNECCGGVLLKRDYKTACELWWKSIPEELKKEFVEWKWFDATIFEEITGIKVNQNEL